MRRYLTSLLLFTIFISGCTFVAKIKDGPTAFDRKQYAVAIPMLKKEHDKAKSRVEKGKIAYMIAESYTQLNESESSIQWYNTAYENGYGVDALKGYAYSLKKTEQYKLAKEAFKNLGIEIGSPYEYRREIEACDLAISWAEDPKNYSVELAAFNSSEADYAPSIFDEDMLVIASDRSSSMGETTYNWTGGSFSDLFIINPNSNQVESFKAPINSPDNEGTVSFTEDFSEMFFTRCANNDKFTDSYCYIMMSTKEGDAWTTPQRLQLFGEDNVNYGDPSISKDGSTLYFSANHPEGWGGHDIYVSERTPDGWTAPQLLGRSINTSGNERFPFIDSDTLFFASDHHPGMGGLDVFKTYKLSNRNWAPAYNLKPPVNSGQDDFAYIVDYRTKKSEGILQKGYFTSSRSNGQGGDDIYIFEKRIPPPPPPIDTAAPPPPPIVYKMILEGYILEKIYETKDNPNSKVLGRKPLNEASVVIDISGKKETVTVGEDGFFTLEITEETDYNFSASKSGYLNNKGFFSSKGIGKDPNNPVTKFTVEIVLDKIFANKEITLDNIYYDFDKDFIRKDAEPTLNKLAEVLNQNPLINIQLASHTDCQGNAGYNEDLSQRRAQSAVNFLIEKGIDPERLSAKGYGENALAIECACTRCSEAEHQANRRTTFKILE